MYFHEERKNLLDVPQGYMIAHCISNDFALGAGVAKQIDKAFNMRRMLFSKEDGNHLEFDECGPYCICCANVYNLITKAVYWQKPKLEDLRTALEDMKQHIIADGAAKIAMPKIGCGLDRLRWEQVREIIKEIFNDMEVEILVCYI